MMNGGNSSAEAPDIMGYSLGEAAKILGCAGIEIVSVKVTAPPKAQRDKYDDSFRVIRVEGFDNGKIEILVCDPEAN